MVDIHRNVKYYGVSAQIVCSGINETHLMENIIYLELLRRKCEVDVGIIEVEEQVDGKRSHKRLEIDFVAN